MNECPSRFTLVQSVAGDLGESEKAVLEEHLKNCPKCQETLQRIRSNADAYRETADAHLQKLMTAIGQEPVPIKKRGPRRLYLLSAAVLATAAALCLLVLHPRQLPFFQSDTPLTETGESFKGQLGVQITALRNGEQFSVETDTVLRKDDALRFSITTASAGYLCILSIDADGQMQLFYPSETDPNASQFVKLPASGHHEMPGSIVLDDSEGIEYMGVFLFREPFDTDTLRRILEKVVLDDERTHQMTKGVMEILRIRKEK